MVTLDHAIGTLRLVLPHDLVQDDWMMNIPGARFGPRAIRSASARQLPFRGFNPRRRLNPYVSPFKIIDCGDIPVSPFDNALALHQMSTAYLELGSRSPAISSPAFPLPKIMTLGGDHSIALPALRALNKIYEGPIAVVHFDAHLDTWHPAKYPSAWESRQSDFTHGSMFWIASNEGLILNGSSAHGGLRSRLSGWDDYEDDERQGFMRIAADDIDDIGTQGIIDAILARVGTKVPVYLSVDIDVIDPGLVSTVVPFHRQQSSLTSVCLACPSVLEPALLSLEVGQVVK